MGCQYDPQLLLESGFTNETSQSAAAADSTNDQLDHRMSAVHPGDHVDVAAEEEKIKLPRTDRIPAAPITITEESEATMSSKREEEEGTFVSDVEDGTKKLAAKEGKGGAAAAAAAKRTSPPKESGLAGLKSLTKKSGADMIRLNEEGDAKELEEPSSATTDSSAISSSPKKDEAKSEQGKRGAKTAGPNFDPSPNKVNAITNMKQLGWTNKVEVLPVS